MTREKTLADITPINPQKPAKGLTNEASNNKSPNQRLFEKKTAA